ncbi:substrate-binding domain-containing protein [Enterobacter bugandensis]|uniref:substrate-binding domain-containing protein n=1 Tax=Enterobacter bugandensis TaxID=881260 RepID=UPI0021D33690|nr:substrate-binding domain-containing protein [Enterobacter bugandensis]MCU6161718.1 substrate-binding domain-containing protein [Enterobacter bugandensis]
MNKTFTALLLMISVSASADVNLYGPGGPHTALLDAAAVYKQKTGVQVNVHYGPQGKWNEDASKNADILFGASEQSALAIVRDHSEHFSEKDIMPLYMRESILLVKKDNPKKIKRIEDLSRPGIGIVVNDGAGKSNTSGTGVWEDIAGRKGNIETVASIRKNIIFFAPNSGSARSALEKMPEADVWITWADWAASNPGIGEVVEISPDYVIWRDMNITVRKDADSETRQFAAWLSSDEAASSFYKFGWKK